MSASLRNSEFILVCGTSDSFFLFRRLFFLYMCPLSSQTDAHTHKKNWSDLWSYFSLRKENKNVKRFWISAIIMKNICWSLCKHKFILPWAWLLIKIQILFLMSYFGFTIWKRKGRNLLHFGAAVKQRWPNFILGTTWWWSRELDDHPMLAPLLSFSLLNDVK